jgi:adenosylhomocysteinase
MDMSFANQALCLEYIVKNRGKLEPRVYQVPEEIDKQVARIKLDSTDIDIDSLTSEQEKYLTSWEEGT